jgi:hypothetical protein
MLDWQEIFSPLQEGMYTTGLHWVIFFTRDIAILIGLGTTFFGFVIAFLTTLKKDPKTPKNYLAGNILIVIMTIAMLFSNVNRGFFFTKSQSLIGIVLIVIGWAITLALRPRLVD